MSTAQMVLNPQTAAYTSSTAPTAGYINSYNASSGAISVTLPQLSTTTVGASLMIQKDPADTTFNLVTVSPYSGDTFYDGRASLILVRPGDKYVIQHYTASSTNYWLITQLSSEAGPQGLLAIASEVSIVSTSSLTPIILTGAGVFPEGGLYVGATFRINARGTMQNQATSGALTLTPYIQNTALGTVQFTTITSANAASWFEVESYIVVRTVGSSGSALAKTKAFANLATTGATSLYSTTTTATTVNTTTSTTQLGLQAQWATNSATNSLLIETATIERVV
jgi:hypothetical protein